MHSFISEMNLSFDLINIKDYKSKSRVVFH